jgi:hypothetical protein
MPEHVGMNVPYSGSRGCSLKEFVCVAGSDRPATGVADEGHHEHVVTVGFAARLTLSREVVIEGKQSGRDRHGEVESALGPSTVRIGPPHHVKVLSRNPAKDVGDGVG